MIHRQPDCPVQRGWAHPCQLTACSTVLGTDWTWAGSTGLKMW